MWFKPPPLSTCLLPLLTVTDLPPPRSRRNPLEASQKCHFSTSWHPQNETQSPYLGSLAQWDLTCCLSVLILTPPLLSLLSQQPSASTMPATAWLLALALNLPTACSRSPCRHSQWLPSLHSACCQELCFQTPSPQSLHPALSSKFLSLHAIFHKWLLISQWLVFDHYSASTPWGQKTFVSYYVPNALNKAWHIG